MGMLDCYKHAFCNAAINKNDGSRKEGDEYLKIMKGAYVRLKYHPDGRDNINELLVHENDWVRKWIATQLLSEEKDDEAIKVLESLSFRADSIGHSAVETLSEFVEGKLTSPFDLEA